MKKIVLLITLLVTNITVTMDFYADYKKAKIAVNLIKLYTHNIAPTENQTHLNELSEKYLAQFCNKHFKNNTDTENIYDPAYQSSDEISSLSNSSISSDDEQNIPSSLFTIYEENHCPPPSGRTSLSNSEEKEEKKEKQ